MVVKHMVVNITRPDGTLGGVAACPLWVVVHPKIGHVAFRLYALIVAKYTDRNDGRAFPTRRTLAVDLGVSVTTINRAITALCQANVIVL